MGNAADQSSPFGVIPTYYDVNPRTLRQIQSFGINGTVTSTTTVATANSIPQITQGTEVWANNFAPVSLSSWIEIEVLTNVMVSAAANYWVALFADYSSDALCVFPGTQSAGASYVIPVTFKHYMMPPSLTPLRFSIRMAPSASNMVLNWYQYGGRISSRVTFKEWSSMSLQGVVAP